MGSSAGSYGADAGSKLNFAFRVRYRTDNPLKRLQGQVTVTFVKDGRTYQFKSTILQSLGIAFQTPGGEACEGPSSPACLGRADVRSASNLHDITDRKVPIYLGGNFSLEVTFADGGGRGPGDSIGITVWNGRTLLFSSEWNGAQTLEKALNGGNVVVR